MPEILFSAPFLFVCATNFCLFLVVSTWSFLPVFVVETGGATADVGLLMGSLGVTSLGSLPLIAPLIDKHGRKFFILSGILVIGLSNAGFLLFDSYSHLMILVRLLQGVAFAACFNGCATAVVDLLPKNYRGRGIGLFGISGSLAVAIGPFLGEQVLLKFGFDYYFYLLIAFGLVGSVFALFVKDSPRETSGRTKLPGFFPTAFNGGHLGMMTLAAIFGSGFAAMNTFFPLQAKSLNLQAGIFFTCYGASLIFVRLCCGAVIDRLDRDKLILACLAAFGFLLISTSQITLMFQTILLGALFGLCQGISYPAMMARMVDKSDETNRGVVVALFTGSFGVGINVSVLAWGMIGEIKGLVFMFILGGIAMFIIAAIFWAGVTLRSNVYEKRRVF